MEDNEKGREGGFRVFIRELWIGVDWGVDFGGRCVYSVFRGGLVSCLFLDGDGVLVKEVMGG